MNGLQAILYQMLHFIASLEFLQIERSLPAVTLY